MKHVHNGWLKLVKDENYHETIELNDEPIAEELEYLSGKTATVSYYISDKEATEEELKEDFLINTLYGNLKSDYGACYSEYTGYLWTNDELKVGGHDLLDELESYDGKYLYLMIDVDEKIEEEKEVARKLNFYNSSVNSLIRSAKNINKSLDELLKDIESNW